MIEACFCRTQLASCFRKFYRADTSSTAVGGFGLGLSIVKHVVEAHGGEIDMQSSLGQGTEVTFSLATKCGEREGLVKTFNGTNLL